MVKKISTRQYKLHTETEFKKYRAIQDGLFVSDFDKYLIELEKEILFQNNLLKR